MSSTRPASSRGRNILRLIFVLAIAGGLAAAFWYWKRPKPIPVILAAAAIGRVESTASNTRAGTVKARRRAKLAPALGGQISRLPVRKGDHVQEGDILLELWNEDLKAQLRLAESQSVAAAARTHEACLMAAQTRREAGRAGELRVGGIESIERIERVEAEADAADASCAAARATAKESEARIAVAAAALDRSVLKAPFPGFIAELNAELGEFITPSPPGIPTLPAVDLIEDGAPYITAPIDEVDAPRIRPGLTARVTLDAHPGKIYPGRVTRIDRYILELEKQARTVGIDVEVEKSCDISELIAGYSADVEILLDARERTLRVPTEAVLDGKRVLVYSQGMLQERTIKVGLSNWQFTEVVEGLQEGELLVTSLDREGVQAGAAARPDDKPGPAGAAGRPAGH